MRDIFISSAQTRFIHNDIESSPQIDNFQLTSQLMQHPYSRLPVKNRPIPRRPIALNPPLPNLPQPILRIFDQIKIIHRPRRIRRILLIVLSARFNMIRNHIRRQARRFLVFDLYAQIGSEMRRCQGKRSVK